MPVRDRDKSFPGDHSQPRLVAVDEVAQVRKGRLPLRCGQRRLQRRRAVGIQIGDGMGHVPSIRGVVLHVAAQARQARGNGPMGPRQ